MPRTRSLAWSELRIGIVAVAAVSVMVALIVAVGGQTGFFWEQYRLYTVFSDVQGLREGAVVRVAGLDVGEVAGLEFVGADVKVTMELNEDIQRQITTRSFASLGSLSLLGETIVTITPSTEGEPLESGAVVPSLPAGAQISDVATGATESLEELTALLRGIRGGEGTVGRLFQEDALYEEMRNLVDEAEDIVARIGNGRGTLGQLIQDPGAYESLEAALNNLQQITRTLAAGEGSLGRLLQDETFAASITAAATNLREITASVQKGQGTIGALLNDPTLYNRLNEVAGRFERIATNLDQGEGTIGRLLEDPSLYENVNAAATELRALVTDIRRDPRKYLNVRVSVF